MNTINSLATHPAISMGYVKVAKFTQVTISAMFFLWSNLFFKKISFTKKNVYFNSKIYLDLKCVIK